MLKHDCVIQIRLIKVMVPDFQRICRTVVGDRRIWLPNMVFLVPSYGKYYACCLGVTLVLNHVQLERSTVVDPNTFLHRKTSIGKPFCLTEGGRRNYCMQRLIHWCCCDSL